MYYNLYKKGEEPQSSKLEEMWGWIFLSGMITSIIGLTITYFTHSDNFIIFMYGYLALFGLNFIQMIVRMIKVGRGYLFLVLCAIVYILFFGEYMYIFNLTSDISKSFYITVISMFVFELLTNYIQKRLEKAKI